MRFISLTTCVVAVAMCACSPKNEKERQIEQAFAAKLDALAYGSTAEEVISVLGEPTRKEPTTEDQNAIVETTRGKIQITKGDPSQLWTYEHGRKFYLLSFSRENTTDPVTWLLTSQMKVYTGAPVQVR